MLGMTVKSIWRMQVLDGEETGGTARETTAQSEQEGKKEKPSIAFVIQREAARPSEESGALAGGGA